jgi:hypothetical protein
MMLHELPFQKSRTTEHTVGSESLLEARCKEHGLPASNCLFFLAGSRAITPTKTFTDTTMNML